MMRPAPLTNQELIEQLKRFPWYAKVRIEGCDCDGFAVSVIMLGDDVYIERFDEHGIEAPDEDL